MGLRQYLKGLAAACCLAAIVVFAIAGSMISGGEAPTATDRAPARVSAPMPALDAVLKAPTEYSTETRDEDHEGQAEATAKEDARRATAP